MLNRFVVAIVLFGFSFPFSWAEESIMIEPPPLPKRLESGEAIEPDINIIQHEDKTIEEYRLAGKLYAIKVIPVVGPTYYLMDTDGDGSLETTQFDIGGGLLVPNWVLFEW